MKSLIAFAFLSGLVLAPTLRAASIEEPDFEVVVVKRSAPFSFEAYTEARLQGRKMALPGCYVGPGLLQYNCLGSIPKLLSEALNLSDFELPSTADPGPLYQITAKLTRPGTRVQLDAALLRFLETRLGVQFHFEPHTIKAIYLTVDSRRLLSALPQTLGPVPQATDSTAPMNASARYLEFLAPLVLVDGRKEFRCTGFTFHLLAQLLYSLWGHRPERIPVVDHTGVTQRFDFSFWEIIQPGDPDFSDARRQLQKYGVGFHARAGVVKVLAVDHVAPDTSFLN